jgi:calcineurin-like phosphoesterase family protein
MSKKWIISDLHFGHKNILKYAGQLRGGSTSEEHDEWLIAQWNSVVKKCDLVYVLGDFAMNKAALHLAKRLKGQKVLVRGNHDIEPARTYLDYFTTIHGLLRFRGVFWMTHAPIHPGSLRGMYNLHGHVHQNSVQDDRYINVCVEMSYGVPRDLDALFEKYKPLVDAALITKI